MLKFWTWQTPDFSLTTGHVDVTKSKYHRSMPAIRDAYSELARRLGTDQIVWCYTSPDQYIVYPWDSKVGWEIRVTAKHVLGYINSWTWERIIGTKAHPPELRDQWLQHAIDNDLDPEDYCEHQLNQYLSIHPPSGCWWDHLFIDQPTSYKPSDVTVLVRHPLPTVAVSQLQAENSSG